MSAAETRDPERGFPEGEPDPVRARDGFDAQVRDRLRIELALLAVQWLGPAVLRPADGPPQVRGGSPL